MDERQKAFYTAALSSTYLIYRPRGLTNQVMMWSMNGGLVASIGGPTE
jgi:hypothetical protein